MHRKFSENFKFAFRLAALSLSCALLFSACRKEGEKVVVQNTAATPVSTASAPEQKLDDFQENLQSVKNAGFDYIFAFRRQDGAAFTSEDKKFLKDNAPRDTNQWRLTADEKAVVAGSNYRFTPEHLTALQTRFAVEDHSIAKPDAADGNANQNANLAVGNIISNQKNANQNANVKNKTTQNTFTDN